MTQPDITFAVDINIMYMLLKLILGRQKWGFFDIWTMKVVKREYYLLTVAIMCIKGYSDAIWVRYQDDRRYTLGD